MQAVVVLLILAVGFWCVMFFAPLAQHVNFWLGMSIAAGVLSLSALWLDRKRWKDIYCFEPRHLLIGLGATVLLYGVFWTGNLVATQLFDFARPQVELVYSTSKQASPFVIGMLLLFLIGPAEEIFWRGFVQRRLADKGGRWFGFVVATLVYALVHAWSGNFMLVMAALLAGAFWGLMFLKYRNLWPGLISHALWDLIIFVLLPIR